MWKKNYRTLDQVLQIHKQLPLSALLKNKKSMVLLPCSLPRRYGLKTLKQLRCTSILPSGLHIPLRCSANSELKLGEGVHGRFDHTQSVDTHILCSSVLVFPDRKLVCIAQLFGRIIAEEWSYVKGKMIICNSLTWSKGAIASILGEALYRFPRTVVGKKKPALIRY